MRARIPTLLLLSSALLGATGSRADIPVLRDRAPSERPSLVVVGVAHFGNPGGDAINVRVDDVLAPARQREVRAVVDALAAYRPTHVVVEFPGDRQNELDARYRAYRAGEYVLTRNEVDQLGLRLAAELGLERVHAADWNDYPPGTEADYDFAAWAERHGHKARLDRLLDRKRASRQEALLARSSIGAFLCEINAPEALARDARAYFDYALFGDTTVNPGAVWVGNWYARNLRIFANLVRLAPKPADRVVAIYGAGHKPLLDRYAAESHAFEVDDAAAVLGCR